MNMAYTLERRASEAGDKIGLIFEDGSQFSFKEMDEMSSQAGNLFKSIGIKKNDRVGVYLQNSPAYVMAMFGLWKIGAAIVPVNIMYKSGELRHAFESTAVSTVLTDSRYLDPIMEIRDVARTVLLMGYAPRYAGDGVIDYDSQVKEQDKSCPAFVSKDKDVAAILFTGGTTGLPKGVITTHNGWDRTLSDLVYAHTGTKGFHELAEKEVPPNIIAFPLFHGVGQQSLLFALRVGRSVLLMERFKVKKYVELVSKYKVRSLVLMPTAIFDLLSYEGSMDFSHVKSVTAIGQQLDVMLKKRFEEKFKIPILVNYGSTEAGHVAGWTMKDIKKGLWKPGSAGKVYPGVNVEIRDDSGKALSPGRVGEVCVKSKVTLEGYAGDKNGSKKLIKDGWLYTTDVGYLDEDNVLFLLGRKREMIKCGGFQVWPPEIEEALIKHPKIKHVAVLGVPDDRLGEMPKAYVVLNEKPSAQELAGLEKDIIEYCRQNMAHFKAIRAVQFIDEMPRSDAGKVLKAQLREMYEDE